MPNGGKLTIEALNQVLDHNYTRVNPEVPPGQYVLICITDTGVGMPPEVLNRAFEPFFTTKEIGQGTGLGLSQVYGFLKQSGGNVKIYSEVGQGTTIKMYFPRTRANDEPGEEELQTPHGDSGMETILLVEDDKDLRSYLTELLRDFNYRVIVVQDAVAALGILEHLETRVDLMLTDVVMPGMNGRELGTRARQLRPKLKVLFMSGYSRNSVVHNGKVDTDVHLIQKPISQTELATRIRDLLDLSV
jgi:CheY-like chemotaxis protein